MPDERLDLFCEIFKGADEATVCGYVTSGSVDLGQQIVDPDFIKRKFPPWVTRWGNVRAQHRHDNAIGVVDAETFKMEGDKPYVEIKVVDAAEIKKVNAGVYKGISIGIKNPTIVSDPKASKGRITDGEIIEISLVDRPANPEANIILIKAAGPGAWYDAQNGTTLTADGVMAGMALAEVSPPAGSPLAERERLLAMMASGATDTAALADVVKAGEANHSFGTVTNPAVDRSWMPSSIAELKKMEAEQANPAAVAPDAEKVQSGNSRRSHESHAHPFDGTHNHAHGHSHPYSGAAMVHHHAHDHADDDIHGAPHEGSSHSTMVAKAADMPDGAADKLVAHLVQFPGTPPPAQPEAIKTASAIADAVEKAAKDFDVQYPQAAAPARPTRLEDTTTNGIPFPKEPKSIAARMESTASQTDQDRDGDIDGMADQDKTGSDQKAGADSAPSGASATSLASKEQLELTFAAHKDEIIALVVKDPSFTAYVASLVKAATAAAFDSSDVVTKAAVDGKFSSVADIAKMAGSLASGLKALAVYNDQLNGTVEGVRSELTKVAADLEVVKRTAQAEKGIGLGSAMAAVSKGFALDPTTFIPANAQDDSLVLRTAFGEDPVAAAAKISSWSEAERMAFAVKMLGGR